MAFTTKKPKAKVTKVTKGALSLPELLQDLQPGKNGQAPALEDGKPVAKNLSPSQRQRKREVMRALADETLSLGSYFEDLQVGEARGIDAVAEIARLCASEFPNLAKFALTYDYLHKPNLWSYVELEDSEGNWRPPTIDEVCRKAGIDSLDLIKDLSTAAFLYGGHMARMTLALSLPGVIQKAVRNATLGEGMSAHQDRRMLIEAGGLMPKQGPFVQVNTTNDNRSLTVGLPQWKETDKVVEGVYFPGQSLLGEGNVVEGQIEDIKDDQTECTVER